MDRHDPAEGIGQNEYIAGDQTPYVGRGILNRCRIVSRHQSFDVRKIGHDFRRTRKPDLSLTLKSVENADRILEVVSELRLDLYTKRLSDQPQRRGCDSGGQNQERQQA